MEKRKTEDEDHEAHARRLLDKRSAGNLHAQTATAHALLALLEEVRGLREDLRR